MQRTGRAHRQQVEHAISEVRRYCRRAPRADQRLHIYWMLTDGLIAAAPRARRHSVEDQLLQLARELSLIHVDVLHRHRIARLVQQRQSHHLASGERVLLLG